MEYMVRFVMTLVVTLGLLIGIMDFNITLKPFVRRL